MIPIEKVFEKLENESLETTIQFLFEQIKNSDSRKKWYINVLILQKAIETCQNNSLQDFDIRGEQEKIITNCVKLLYKIEEFQNKQDFLEREKEIDKLKKDLEKLNNEKESLILQQQIEKNTISELQKEMKETFLEKKELEIKLTNKTISLKKEGKKLSQNLVSFASEVEKVEQELAKLKEQQDNLKEKRISDIENIKISIESSIRDISKLRNNFFYSQKSSEYEECKTIYEQIKTSNNIETLKDIQIKLWGIYGYMVL